MLSALALVALLAQDTDLASRTRQLMPVPRSVRWGTNRLTLDSTFTIGIAGHRDPRLERAVTRTLARLRGRTALRLGAGPAADSGTLVIRAAGPGQRVPAVTEDESYLLEVTPPGARLTAPTVVGALRGLETFLQLVAADPRGFYLPEARVEDAPRFPWRGLLVDAGRHFMPPEMIRRTLDGMAAVKLNVLHWHLSEDQGFRVESRRFPRLHQLGSDGLYYTQDQIRELVAYAGDRGIRVVPEFDMPGHSQSWFVGYPRYSAGPGPYAIERNFGVFDPVFDPTSEAVYRFLDGFIGEMAPLFPDAYWHIGGDEVNGVQWNANPRIAAFKAVHRLADNEALQAYFNQRLLRILTRHGKRMVGWDEILHPDLPLSAVIQSWRGTEYLGRAAQQGRSGILSAPYYLDHQSTAEYHYLADPLPAATEATLTPEQRARVLGGEACMWAEHVSPETVDSRIWPRLAAVAERLWSPREVTDVGDMYRRLWITSARLEELGLQHESHTERMLRRMVPDGYDLNGLRQLLAYAQPLTFGQRSQLLRPNQLTPLVGLVDAARPDPPARWKLQRLLTLYLEQRDSTAFQDLAEVFALWDTLPPIVNRERTAVTASAGEAALALSGLHQLGLDALAYLGRHERAPEDWVTRSLALLAQADRPQGPLRLAVIEGMRTLIQRAGGATASSPPR